MVNACAACACATSIIEAPLVISTVPWYRVSRAVRRRRPPALETTVANAAALASLPIVTVNLWFDAAVMQEPLVGLPGRNFQWVFDRRAIVGGDGVAPVADLERRGDDRLETNEELAAMALSGSARGAAGRAIGARCARASRCAKSDRRFRWRPTRRRGRRRETAIDGFLLAGDWIETGLPATIESAVVSGHRSCQSTGH